MRGRLLDETDMEQVRNPLGQVWATPSGQAGHFLVQVGCPRGAGLIFPAGPAPRIGLSEPAVAPVRGKKTDLRRKLTNLRHP